jgi:hypothetical protein
MVPFMLFSASSRPQVIFSTSLLAVSALSSAQTLQHRPPSKPTPPPAQTAPPPLKMPQTPQLPKGTSLQVEVPREYPMKAGEAIEGRLLHPIFADGKLAVPENTTLHGTVVALEPDNKTRWRARLRGDFTPFHTAQVRFDQLVLPGGPLRIDAATASDGAPVLQLTTPGASPKRSLFGQLWAHAKSNMHDRVAFFTAPGKGDRALQVLYHQLPYHPQRIEAHTAWSFELLEPLELPGKPAAAAAPPKTDPTPGKPETWEVNAVLMGDLTSASARAGDPVKALVVEPVYDKNKQLVVPQGSALIGKVTAAQAARSFGRNGKLRFTFQQVQFPEGFQRPVEGSLAGAATEKTQDLTLDAEGTISPRNKSSAVAPLLLTLLAGRALDNDGNLTLQTGVASNGFGVIGRIVGIAAGNRNIAAGIGFYAAGLSFYDNFLRSGRDVVFPRDTRIEIETTPLRAPVLTPGTE